MSTELSRSLGALCWRCVGRPRFYRHPIYYLFTYKSKTRFCPLPYAPRCRILYVGLRRLSAGTAPLIGHSTASAAPPSVFVPLRSMSFLSDDFSDYNTHGNAALSRSLEQWLNDWEADGQAGAAESPAPPQPTSPAVPTDASGVGEPEVSSPPRPSSPSFLRPSLPPSLPPSPSLSPLHPARGDRLLDRCVAGARSGRRCSRSAGGRP